MFKIKNKVKLILLFFFCFGFLFILADNYRNRIVFNAPNSVEVENSELTLCTRGAEKKECNDNTDCIIFFWDYTSRNRSIEAYKYILEISLNNDFFDIIYTSGEISTNKHSHVYENTNKDLEYEKDYYWRIKAGDEYGTWSDWAVDENKFNF